MSKAESKNKAKHEKNDWLNTETGELASGLLVIQGRKFPKGMEFCTLFQESFELLLSVRPKTSCIVGITCDSMTAPCQDAVDVDE